MYKHDAVEALPIVRGTLNALLAWAPGRGRPGADLRSRAGLLSAEAPRLLQYDRLGEPMAHCFDLAVETGMTLWQAERVRRETDKFQPERVGAKMIKHALIQLNLVAQTTIIAERMEFVTRTDVEDTLALVNAAFSSVAEAVADEMDAMTYRAIVALHAAVTFYLVEFARPLPRMLTYRFNQPMTTLTTAYRLYANAGRADEIRNENKIIHPAFTRREGRALSA